MEETGMKEDLAHPNPNENRTNTPAQTPASPQTSQPNEQNSIDELSHMVESIDGNTGPDVVATLGRVIPLLDKMLNAVRSNQQAQPAATGNLPPQPAANTMPPNSVPPTVTSTPFDSPYIINPGDIDAKRPKPSAWRAKLFGTITRTCIVVLTIAGVFGLIALWYASPWNQDWAIGGVVFLTIGAVSGVDLVRVYTEKAEKCERYEEAKHLDEINKNRIREERQRLIGRRENLKLEAQITALKKLVIEKQADLYTRKNADFQNRQVRDKAFEDEVIAKAKEALAHCDLVAHGIAMAGRDLEVQITAALSKQRMFEVISALQFACGLKTKLTRVGFCHNCGTKMIGRDAAMNSCRKCDPKAFENMDQDETPPAPVQNRVESQVPEVQVERSPGPSSAELERQAREAVNQAKDAREQADRQLAKASAKAGTPGKKPRARGHDRGKEEPKMTRLERLKASGQSLDEDVSGESIDPTLEKEAAAEIEGEEHGLEQKTEETTKAPLAETPSSDQEAPPEPSGSPETVPEATTAQTTDNGASEASEVKGSQPTKPETTSTADTKDEMAADTTASKAKDEMAADTKKPAVGDYVKVARGPFVSSAIAGQVMTVNAKSKSVSISSAIGKVSLPMEHVDKITKEQCQTILTSKAQEKED